MKKILLSILLFMGLSQAMSSDLGAPDYAELIKELALLEQQREQKTDARFSRFPVLPPIKQNHQPKPLS